MIADDRFCQQPKSFWASVRTISQAIGYTDRATKLIKVPSLQEIKRCFLKLGLNVDILEIDGHATVTANNLCEYFQYRASVLNEFVEPRLMSLAEATELFNALRERYKPLCPLPLNKQKGDKKGPAYFTGIINILIEAHAGANACDYDPRQLTTITLDGIPV